MEILRNQLQPRKTAALVGTVAHVLLKAVKVAANVSS